MCSLRISDQGSSAAIQQLQWPLIDRPPFALDQCDGSVNIVNGKGAEPACSARFFRIRFELDHATDTSTFALHDRVAAQLHKSPAEKMTVKFPSSLHVVGQKVIPDEFPLVMYSGGCVGDRGQYQAGGFFSSGTAS